MPNETALADDGTFCIESAASECATSSHLKVRLFQTRVKLRAAVELALEIGTGAVVEEFPSRDVVRELFAELLAEEEAEEEAEEVKAEEEEEEDASVLMLPRMG